MLVSRQRPAPSSTSKIRPRWTRWGYLAWHEIQRRTVTETSLPIYSHHHREPVVNSSEYPTPTSVRGQPRRWGGEYIPGNALPHHIHLDDTPSQTAHGLEPYEYTHNRFAAVGWSTAQIQGMGLGGLKGKPVQTTDVKGGCPLASLRCPLGNGVVSIVAFGGARPRWNSVWPTEGISQFERLC